MSSFVSFVNNILYQPYIVPLFLIAVGLYFTIRTKAVQIRLFPEMFRVVMEKPENEKGVSSFAALMVSTASRVGTGNIIGVCTALILAGSYLLDVDHRYHRCGQRFHRVNSCSDL